MFIKYSKDKESLDKVLRHNEKRFRELERRAADVIQVITNAELRYGEGEGSLDMCQYIQTFGYTYTYKLLLYPNLFYKTPNLYGSKPIKGLDFLFCSCTC